MRIVLKGGRLIDGTDGKARDNTAISIEDGKLTALDADPGNEPDTIEIDTKLLADQDIRAAVCTLNESRFVDVWKVVFANPALEAQAQRLPVTSSLDDAGDRLHPSGTIVAPDAAQSTSLATERDRRRPLNRTT